MQRQQAVTNWLRDNVQAASDAEMVAIRIQHPTMQLLRQALQLVGQASRDAAWAGEHDRGGDKVRQVMELLVELTSTAPR